MYGSLQRLAHNLPFLQKHEFSVDMSCEGCAEAVSRVLNKLGGEHLSVGERMGRWLHGSYVQIHEAYKD